MGSESKKIGSVSEFVRVTIASGLIGQEECEDLLRSFNAQFPDFVCEESRMLAFSEFLIETGNLTVWQCRTLLEGKYKGFYQNGFVILKYVGTDEKSMKFLARETSTGKERVMRVSLAADLQTSIEFEEAGNEGEKGT